MHALLSFIGYQATISAPHMVRKFAFNRLQINSTLIMTSAQVVETSVNVTNNSPSRDYSHPDDQSTQTNSTLSTSNQLGVWKIWNPESRNGIFFL